MSTRVRGVAKHRIPECAGPPYGNRLRIATLRVLSAVVPPDSKIAGLRAADAIGSPAPRAGDPSCEKSGNYLPRVEPLPGAGLAGAGLAGLVLPGAGLAGLGLDGTTGLVEPPFAGPADAGFGVF